MLVGSVWGYRLIDRIDRGTESIIYSAKSTRGDDKGRIVAVKRISTFSPRHHQLYDHLNNELNVNRHLQQKAGFLSSGIVKIERIVTERFCYVLPVTAKCLVMEYIDGRNLRKVKATAAVSTEDYIRMMMHVYAKVCAALQFLHSCGYIHSDIKPDNIMLTRHHDVRLIDFGMCCSKGTKRRSGEVKGTDGYLAPEQIYGGRINERTDLYSLAVVMYIALGGNVMSQVRPDIHDPSIKHRKEPLLRPIRELNRNVPPELEEILLKSSIGDPSARDISTEEIINILGIS